MNTNLSDIVGKLVREVSSLCGESDTSRMTYKIFYLALLHFLQPDVSSERKKPPIL